jgi:hypothetical protein
MITDYQPGDLALITNTETGSVVLATVEHFDGRNLVLVPVDPDRTGGPGPNGWPQWQRPGSEAS